MIDWYAELLHKENQEIMNRRKSSNEIKPRQAESDFNDWVAIGLIVLVVCLIVWTPLVVAGWYL
jgi:uncharacterized membrane protein YukC